MNRASRLDWLGVYAIFFVVLLYGPVLLLPLFSFNDNIYITFPLKALRPSGIRDGDQPGPDGGAEEQPQGRDLRGDLSTVLGLTAAKPLPAIACPARRVVGMIMLPLVCRASFWAFALLSSSARCSW